MLALGQLTQIDPRTVWMTEAQHFTPWLASPTGLALLGDAIGLDLELEFSEAAVGPFRADVVCRETGNDQLVLIENQLERTDHIHLGQLLTYAAGLKAVTIVWIAREFTDEHRAALDWLNLHTDDDVSLFGLEIALWKIGASEPAPQFTVISKPNDWTRAAAGARSGGEAPSETKALQLKFWSALRDHLKDRKSKLKAQAPRPRHWYNFSIGRSNIHLSAIANSAARQVQVKLYLPGPLAKVRFQVLQQQRAEVESQLGGNLVWDEKPQRQACEIITSVGNFDLTNEASWPQHLRWIADTLEKFHTVFAPIAQTLPGGNDAGEVELDPSDVNR